MLETLLYPKSVAVIGASRNEAKVGHAVLANLINGKFKGPIVPVNPDATEILGLKCYKSLDDYKGQIDLSVIVVAGKFVKDAVAQLDRCRREIGHRHHRGLPRSQRRGREGGRGTGRDLPLRAACAWSGRIASACSTRTTR